MTTPRNAPCPCGSGRKYKLCCGTTREQDQARRREVQRLVDALAACVALADDFPELRPQNAGFSAWADKGERCRCDADDETIMAGVEAIHRGERRRIARVCSKLPDPWRSLCGALGNESVAKNAVLAGAVLAALGERCELDPLVLELLEERAALRAREPADVLALALDGCAVWSLDETTALDEALELLPEPDLPEDVEDPLWNETVRLTARRLRTRAHEKRLDRLIARLRRRLPYAGAPLASDALAAACAAYDRSSEVRRRVAEHLLADSLGRLFDPPALERAA